MAHHQHHGPEYEAQLSRSLSTRPTSPHATSMPSISEDETLAECDEPPDVHAPVFSKAIFSNMPRRQSLLTRALHTDSEHDEDHFSETYFSKLPSVSSSCSNPSVRSNGDFTSDDGHHSPSTRPSTPGSPRSVMSIPKLEFLKPIIGSHQDSDEPKPLQLSSPAPVQDPVEATLGRRRCIMFSCGRKDKTDAPKQDSVVKPQTTPEPAPAPRKSIIRFACPFKADKAAKESAPTARVPSPAPPVKSISTAPFRRRHRDSDTTIRNESPTTPRAQIPQSPRNVRRFSQQSDIGRTEACRFHEFASEEETQDDWTQESTCYKSRLTVDDTLKKERDIRRLAEEADEEEALEQDSNDEDDFDSSDSDCSDVSDTGFHSDDEEGFAESDDEDDDSDYEWWAPRKSRARSPYIGGDVFRPVATRTYSNSSYDSDDSNISPGKLRRLSRRHVRPVQIRPGTPELPDSTDFVCGTLDEDRPMEAAYVSCVTARKAAKHRIVPQDIDPSFPVSDPEIGSDDDEVASDGEESEHFMHGKIENIDHDEEPRGRRMHSDSQRRSPVDSPLRPRSPPPKKTVHRSPPPKKSCAGHRSPAPVHLFNLTSPRRLRSPVPAHCMTSPPPSRRGSMLGDGNFGIAFLSNRSGELTHTASLPRSPHPMARRSQPSELKFDDEEDSDGSATDKPTDSHRYTRGAIDIAQGLERKRLKRREKFYQKYCRKQEKCERKGRTRPPPGKGAQRMRQIGLECAIYHGKRMLSI